MFISSAYAQAAAGAAEQSPFGMLGSILPFALIFVVFYFLLFRPQQKKMKDHRAMISAVKRGDRVVTSGGIIGVVTKVVDDNELQIEIAEGVRVRALRSSISEVLTRSEPAKLQDNKASDSKDSAGDKKGSGR
ncbi:MAG: preprotein translocase subunit YajC [Rhodospirillaceae bacterium]|jgi:preprotein translocase subunit YajC|nr:preprotein translocase subunit YajC [Rhodospirillaceae bacterium]